MPSFPFQISFKVSLALNALVVAGSLGFLVYTSVAKDHLVGHTRAFVTEKTVSYAKPTVELARNLLASPLSAQVIPADQKAQLATEIELYESDPANYITSLTSAEEPSFGKGKVAAFKEKVYAHFQSTFDALIHDLRIFSASNLLAGLFGLGLLFKKDLRDSDTVIAFSFLVFAAVAASSYSYFGGVSFLRILFKTHLGLWYPVGIGCILIFLVLKYRLHTRSGPASES